MNTGSDKKSNDNPGDMSTEEFRKYGYQMVDWIADYFSNIEKFPVLSQIKPGDIKKQLPPEPPDAAEDFNEIFADIDKIIMPGITHWNHPGFMAYFNSNSSGPGILAEMLSAALNVNGMLWRTSPSATELEQLTLNWLKSMLKLPDEFWGIIYDTASVSTLHALAAAREQAGMAYQFRAKGMLGSGAPRFRLYCSEHAHSSVEKGAITLGIGLEGIKKIAADVNYKMIPAELEKAINNDLKDGWVPFCVTATVGTTSTTSIDPVDEISEICARHNIWLHIDAAYGGTAAILPEMRWILNGVEKADSIVVNPHKWMFTPIDLSAFYTRKPDMLKRAFSLVAEYLKTSEQNSVESYMDYGIQLGRRFRALKLWFIIRYFGVEGIKDRIRNNLTLTAGFAEWINSRPEFELMAPSPLGVVCFRASGNGRPEEELDALNEKLMENINKSGLIFLSHTKLNGKFVIRLSASGIRTSERYIKLAEQLLLENINSLLKEK